MQLLENSVKKQLLDRCERIQAVVEDKSQKAALNLNLRRSVSVACGASIVELKIKAPTWVGQVCYPYQVSKLELYVYWGKEMLAIFTV